MSGLLLAIAMRFSRLLRDAIFPLTVVAQAIPVVVQRNNFLHYIAPPVPPPLHYSVEAIDAAMLRDVTDRLDYLPTLTRASGPVPPEQIIIAHVREAFEVRGGDHEWLERVASELGRIYAREYDMLLPILRAIDPGVGLPAFG